MYQNMLKHMGNKVSDFLLVVSEIEVGIVGHNSDMYQNVKNIGNKVSDFLLVVSDIHCLWGWYWYINQVSTSVKACTGM